MSAVKARASTVFFFASTIGSIGLAIVYWRGGQPRSSRHHCSPSSPGASGLGIVTLGRRAMPDEEVTEERHSVASSEAEVEAFAVDFEAGAEGIGRRRLLLVAAGSAVAAFGAALLFPLRSLGPRPGKGLAHTPTSRAGCAS